MTNGNSISALTNKVWAAADAMRAEGLLITDYMEQLSLFMFLKMLQEREDSEQEQAQMLGGTPTSLFDDEKYKWANWSQFNGPVMREFLVHELFPYLQDRPGIVGKVFRDVALAIEDPGTLKAVVGVLTGDALEPISSPLLGWSDFKQAFPNAMVLDRDATGFSRPYGENPYAGYDNPDSQPFLFRGDVDDRAVAKQRVVGVATDSAARAWTLEALSNGMASVTNGEVGDTPVVIFWKAGQSSALDADQVVSGRDVGSVGVFAPVVDGEQLTFSVEGDVFVDEQTGSVWDITGTAIEGELARTSLDQIHHLDTFWFAWSTYQPETDLIE